MLVAVSPSTRIISLRSSAQSLGRVLKHVQRSQVMNINISRAIHIQHSATDIVHLQLLSSHKTVSVSYHSWKEGGREGEKERFIFDAQLNAKVI